MDSQSQLQKNDLMAKRNIRGPSSIQLVPEPEKEQNHQTMMPRFPIMSGKSYALIKRAIDIGLVVCSLPLFLPLTLIIMIAMKIEDRKGPVFFFQERTGYGGRRFKMFKFRTMVVNAEEIKKTLAAQNQLIWPDFKIKNDPRITRIGRVLRKTSLDELPQLLNVLFGDMSLVGPRPTSFKPETYQLWQSERLEVRPGVTGLWQIGARGTIEFDQRVRLDIAYVKNISLALDLKILLFTIPAALKGT